MTSKHIFTAALFFMGLFIVSGCSTTYENRSPLGETFPSITGTALTKETLSLPDDFPKEKVLLLLGYVQDAQFDIDRWFIGLDMTKTEVVAYELPTIAGMFPRMFQTQIDDGMRRGIPKEIWGGVITIYEDGETVQKMTGNENPNNARVILLNAEREIIYFYDRGFSVAALNEVRGLL
jgi:outer membrane protein assembly factor BamE (lipoprotein component of BamABCDE complex)